MICAVSLKTEYMTNPMGIDSGKQRLSWKVQGAKKQSACQIRLRVNEGEWSEREPVNSDRMRVFLKMPLSSRDRVCWQVRLTDENGETGPWSESAVFEMGLLERSDWQAKWIMGDYDHDTNPKVRYPVDCFRKEVALKKGLARARLYATACGLYEACVDGEKVGDQVMAPGSTAFQKRVHYQTYDVTALLAGKETAELTFQLADGYYASRQGVFGKAKPFGAEPKLLAQLELYYEDGTEVILGTDETFSWSNDGPIRLADMKDGR